MSDVDELFTRVIKRQIKGNQFNQVITGTAVNITQTTCTVKRKGSPDLTDVRLDAIDDTIENQFTVFPKEGSFVIVGIVDGLKTEAVVLRCSEVDFIKIKCGGISLIDTFSKFITEINNAIINTPTGAGTMSPATVTKLKAVEADFKKIFK